MIDTSNIQRKAKQALAVQLHDVEINGERTKVVRENDLERLVGEIVEVLTSVHFATIRPVVDSLVWWRRAAILGWIAAALLIVSSWIGG